MVASIDPPALDQTSPRVRPSPDAGRLMAEEWDRSVRTDVLAPDSGLSSAPWMGWDVPAEVNYFSKNLGHRMYAWVTLVVLYDTFQQNGYSVCVSS